MTDLIKEIRRCRSTAELIRLAENYDAATWNEAMKHAWGEKC